MSQVRSVLAATLALVALAAACGGGASSGDDTIAASQDITALDGALTLRAPAGSPSITVEPLDHEEALAGVEPDPEVEVLAAVSLGPDGHAFSGEPVSVTFDTGIPYPEGGAPVMMAVLRDADGWDLPLSQTVTRGPAGTAILEAEVTHFSELWYLLNRTKYRLSPPTIDAFVGETFTADVVLEGVTESEALRLSSIVSEYRRVVSGSITTADTPLTFACIDPGNGTYGYFVDFEYFTERRDETPTFASIFGNLGTDIAEDLDRRSERVADHKIEVEGAANCVAPVTQEDEDLERILRDTGLRLDELLDLIELLGPDAVADFIYSISGVAPGDPGNDVDLLEWLAVTFLLDQAAADTNFNLSVFECGAGTDGSSSRLVLCPDGVESVAAGPMTVIAARFADDLPVAGGDRLYTYAAVFDSDATPAGNWEFQGAFDWDFYRDTDRWYQAHFDPAGGWRVEVTAAGAGPVPSGVRVVIEGSTIVWFIPGTELPGDPPLVRVTAFRHDGSFQPEVSAGDVSGPDPTVPPGAVLQTNFAVAPPSPG